MVSNCGEGVSTVGKPKILLGVDQYYKNSVA